MKPNKAVIRAISGSKLTQDSDHYSPVDTLTALAQGSIPPERYGKDKAGNSLANKAAMESAMIALGKTLLAMKFAGHTYFERSIEELASVLQWQLKGLTSHYRIKVAHVAVREWVEDACQTCRGASEGLDSHGVMRPCMACNHTGKRLWTDAERNEVLQVEAPSKFARSISIAAGAIPRSIDCAMRDLAARLA